MTTGKLITIFLIGYLLYIMLWATMIILPIVMIYKAEQYKKERKFLKDIIKRK